MGVRSRISEQDSIGELERAGQARFEEAFLLAIRGRRHAAVYLLGYYVEITLKTIFFRRFGFRVGDPIRQKDLRAASDLVREQFRIRDDHEQHHNPVFWARAIVGLHELDGVTTPRGLTEELVWRSQNINNNWAVRMRYAADLVRPDDWDSVRQHALWLRANYRNFVNTERSREA